MYTVNRSHISHITPEQQQILKRLVAVGEVDTTHPPRL